MASDDTGFGNTPEVGALISPHQPCHQVGACGVGDGWEGAQQCLDPDGIVAISGVLEFGTVRRQLIQPHGGAGSFQGMRRAPEGGNGASASEGAEFLDALGKFAEVILGEFMYGFRIDLVAELLESGSVANGVHGE